MTVTDASVWLDALAGSHDRLGDLVGDLDDDGLREGSYCDDWTIAQVLSHLGSGAEITEGIVDAVVAGEAPPSRDNFPAIWARWDAMAPREVRDAALSTDGEFVEKLEHLGDALDELEFTLFGVMRLDAAGLIWTRLSEHALHTWDIAVVLDPRALVDPDAVRLLIDRLPQSIGRLGTPERANEPRPYAVQVATSSPDRTFRLEVGDVVSLAPGGDGEGSPAQHTLRLPAEAFLRLAYGRLDPSHTPPIDGAEERATLDGLRAVFPGR